MARPWQPFSYRRHQVAASSGATGVATTVGWSAPLGGARTATLGPRHGGTVRRTGGNAARPAPCGRSRTTLESPPMEIQTAPYRPTPTSGGRHAAVRGRPRAGDRSWSCCPSVLGLQRYVMTGDSMRGGVDRGALLFERVVPVSDLEVGDVITYRAPAGADEGDLITHRIVAIGADGITTRGDARPTVDPWTVQPTRPTMPRVVLTLPWVGWAYLLLLDSQWWLLVAASVLALVALTWGQVLPGRGRTGA